MGTPRDGQKALDWWDCVGLIVGIMLGTGIFTVFPKLAAAHNPSTAAILAAWGAGALIALCGAFCFAELAGLFPRNGGEYVFLKEAFDRPGRAPVSFLFAWAQVFVIRPASLVSLSIIMAVNVEVLLRHAWGAAPAPAGERALLIALTHGGLVFFALAVMAGIKTSKRVQNAFTVMKVLCLAVLVGVGLYLGRDKVGNLDPVLPAEGTSWGSLVKGLSMALIPVMWVFGGWNEAPYIAGDMKEPERNIPKALIAGLLGLGFLYGLINLVYVLHLTPAGLASSWTFASDIMGMWFGPKGEVVMAATLVLSTAGAINGLTVTGARMTDAFARDLGLLSDAEGPGYAKPIVFNLLLCLGLAFIVDCRPDSIDGLLVFTAGVVWIFFALTVGCTFVFRRRLAADKIPYKMPFFPAMPVIFIVMCGFMLYGAWEYKPRETVYGILAILAGVPVYLLGAETVHKWRARGNAG